SIDFGYYAIRRGINIVKDASPITIISGQSVTYSYIVTNTGNVPETNVVVVDDNATPGNTSDDFNPTPVLVAFNNQQYNTGDVDHDGTLDPGEVWSYTSTRTLTVAPGTTTSIG